MTVMEFKLYFINKFLFSVSFELIFQIKIVKEIINIEMQNEGKVLKRIE